MTPQLYTKHVSEKGKVTYKEHHETEINVSMTDEQIVTLVLSLGTAIMESLVYRHAPHAAAHKTTMRVVEALRAMKFPDRKNIDGEMVELGVHAWNAAMKVLQTGLK